MEWSTIKKAEFVLSMARYSYVSMVRKLRRERGRYTRIPLEVTIRKWTKKFEEKGVVSDTRDSN